MGSAGDAASTGVGMLESRWADASFLSGVVDFVAWAGLTGISCIIKPGRGLTGAPSCGVDVGKVGGADTGVLDCVSDFVGGAGFAFLGEGVQELGRGAHTLTINCGGGAWGAADFLGSSGCSTSRAATLEQC